MPTNVSPEYKKAQEQYRRARDPAERLQWLREMLSTIPKHKGTEHLQADIKSKIRELTDELSGPRKGAARTGPVQVIKPEGAAQIALVGPPNVGKSSLHQALTGSRAEIGPYPFTTRAPLPGMFLHDDVAFQLVDLPPISEDTMESWLPNALQPAHAALLVIDLVEPGCVAAVATIRERLDQKRIGLVDDWPGRLPAGLLPADWGAAAEPETDGGDDPADVGAASDGQDTGATDDEEELEDPFRIELPTLLVVAKIDRGFDPDEVDLLLELTETRFPVVAISVEAERNLAQIGSVLMHGLKVVRVYTKVPGKEPDYEKPYTLFAGDTVADLARLIHRDMAAAFQFARVWGSAKFDGQQVGREHVLRDRDVVEIHA